METLLQELTAVVSEFLESNGGRSNGYDTYARGVVKTNTIGSLVWRTPDCDDLTGREVRDRGRELNESLRAILAESDYKECEVISEYHEHGVCDVYVSIATKMRVPR